MTKKILILPGDGIGKEIVAEAMKVLECLRSDFGLEAELEQGLVGGSAYDATGHPLPDATLAQARESDAILLGAVGGPKWEPLDISVRPEKGLLGLRAGLELFANLRPALLYPQLAEASTLKPELVAGLDLMIVRELTGGIYFGQPRGVRQLDNGERQGFNTLVYSESEIERIARVAFDIARKRGSRVCSVDKANVLECTELWREVVTRVGRDYPDVELSHMYVDNAAMQLVRAPKQFDVMVTDQYVRRHPLRLRRHAHRFDRHVALGVSGRRRPGYVRADPWLGPRHCGQGCGQPSGHHPVAGHDAALLPRSGGTGRTYRAGGEPGPRQWAAHSGYPLRRLSAGRHGGDGRRGGGGSARCLSGADEVYFCCKK